MSAPLRSSRFQTRLAQKLAESLTGTLPQGTARKVSGATAFPGKATAVIGMRRAGKTTYLHQIRRERLAGGAERSQLPYLNFEDEMLSGLQASDLTGLIEEYYRHYPDYRGRKRVTWCFDEIQVVPGWERFVRRLLDEEKVEIFVSGSSAALLSREIATALRGRAWEVLIHPFSFAEYLDHHHHELPARPSLLTARQRSTLEHRFHEWLRVGGFPEAQSKPAATRHRLLADYVDVTMMRDVLERHQVVNVVGLRWMVRHLLGNAGALFSAEKFYQSMKSQGIAIGKETVHELLSHLEDCFLVRTLWVDTKSERRRMVNPRKAYPVDPGLIPIYDLSGSANLGHSLETAVMLELERRRWALSYVRTRGELEVDFLARKPGGPAELIQVCADARAPETADREFRALAEAGAEHPRAVKRLLVGTADGVPNEAPKGVRVQPAYEWMLESD